MSIRGFGRGEYLPSVLRFGVDFPVGREPLHTSAYVSIRQYTSAHVSTRQHTSAYVSTREQLVRQGERACTCVTLRLCEFSMVDMSSCLMVLLSLDVAPSGADPLLKACESAFVLVYYI